MLTWDRSHEWVLERFYHDQTRVTIQFRQAPASVAELAAIRRCLPQFQNMSPTKVRAAIGDSRHLPLGVMWSPDARLLIQEIERQGLQVLAEGASFIGYLPFDRTTGCAWLIEDDEEAAAVAQAMMAAGVPIHNVEA